ncbi:MAG TPA: Ig-like domain-containing protein, partial [Candidatus Binatia bacterium]
MKKYALVIILEITVACFFARAVFAAPQATGAKRPLLEGAPADVVPWVADPNQSDTFTFQVLTQPTNGSAAAVSSGQELEYTPDSGFTSGTDSYTYSATDQNGNSVNGKARVRVYDAVDNLPTHTSALTKCTRNGTLADDGSGMIGVRTKSNDCTFYSRRRTRVAPDGT